jgi:hypothetical protein
MLVKWTIQAFAVAAALPLGIAAAQNADPAPVPTTATADDAQNTAPGAQDDAAASQSGPRDAVPNDSRFAPSNVPAGDQPQVSDHVRAATQHLNIDDETRSRYRWQNGEWWFKTKSGQWKIYRDGKWVDFDPTTYQAPAPGGAMFSPQPGGPAPQTYGASQGYYYQGQPYRAYRPTYGAYNGFNNGYGYNGYNGGFNNGMYGSGYGYGQGYQTYNPSNDTYNGYNGFGQSYSVPGGQYRGAVIGSQIGGQLGGQTGAMLGGAIGARAGRGK